MFNMKRFLSISFAAACFAATLALACSKGNTEGANADSSGKEESGEEITRFNNPITSFDWPDPTIWCNDGIFYTVATGVNAIFSSTDMVHWNRMNPAPLSPSAISRLRQYGSNFWAPDVVKVGSKWMMYLTCYNSADDCSIAALSSDLATGPFEWAGIITRSKDTGIQDTIDPEVVYDREQSKLWLFFGSIGRVHRVLLRADGCSVAPGAKYVPVAGLSYAMDKTRSKVFEGSYLHRHEGFWYLFVSCGNYGDASYRIKVGRSASLDGEFLDKEGNKMLDGYGSEVLSSKDGDRFYGPGHNGEIFTDLRGQDYIFYHCHDNHSGGKSRFTFLQRIFWGIDGWPYFENGKPLGEDYAPKTEQSK